MYWLFARLSAVILLLLSVSSAYAETRVALVIGNSTYQVSPLKNPANDAKLIAATLSDLGFEVLVKTDLTSREMIDAIGEFKLELMAGATVGFFYYAGHGMQIDGTNFLIPKDNAKIQSNSQVRFSALSVGDILHTIDDAGVSLNVIVLDACRDNPFSSDRRSQERGLSRIDTPRGQRNPDCLRC